MIDIKIDGKLKHVIVTGGKEAIFDVLEARTGKYMFSIDLGLQDLVSSIDPKTGIKTIDRNRLTPGDGTVKHVCPHSGGGGKNWIPSAFDPNTKLLIVPLVEACMDLIPVGLGEQGVLKMGIRFGMRPREDADGNYGRLEAVDLETRKPVWVTRQRAASTTGVLVTAGGLVFAGYMDRSLQAFDEKTGQRLWQTRLSDVPNSNAITYEVAGKQFVAVVTGNGGTIARDFARLTPELTSPVNRTSILTVFALPSVLNAPK